MNFDFKNHKFNFKLIVATYSTGGHHYFIHRCKNCGYWLYNSYMTKNYYWIINDNFEPINSNNEKILSCEEVQIKQLLE